MVQTLSVNNEYNLLQLTSSMQQNAPYWTEWKVLFISLTDCDDDTCEDCLIWIKSIVHSYLKNIEGQIYFCENQGIHILCKNTGIKILNEAGQQICDLISGESNIDITYHVYDLAHDIEAYANSVQDITNNIFHLHIETQSSAVGAVDDTRFQALQITEKDLHEHIIPKKPKVLLVEDDPVTRWMVRNVLKNACEFMTAPCANKVFSLYATYQPDIVFLDIDLPDYNGDRVLNWIMRNDPGANVVMFSGNNSIDNVTQTMESGAKGFIAKPFLRDDLFGYINSYTSQTQR